MTLKPTIARRHAEWSLLVNALVEVRHNGQVLRTGFVEAAMPDSSALWIAADGKNSRRMFEAAEGHEVWVTPQELVGDLSYRMTVSQMFKAAPSNHGRVVTPVLWQGRVSTADR